MIEALECAACGASADAGRLQNLCPSCGGPLLARYDLARVARSWRPADLVGRPRTVWRWREVLPVAPGEEPLTLGEGGTPLLPSRAIGPALGLSRLSFKDESGNPTLSFKARGLAVAMHRARALGARHVAIPSAGNAGSATAAYAAAAGLPCTVAMPADTPRPIVDECHAYGARVELVDGTIADAGAWIRERSEAEGWFDVSTLREPYRLEGKKTMGYELAEQLGWRLPDVILYPTGGGTGLVGMWKAFEEMETLGWIDGSRPKMVAVQSEGCAPIARAFHAGEEFAEPWQDAETCAAGIRVPAAVGDFLMLRALRESGGTAVTVSDAELLEACRLVTSREGLFVCPEGGAAVAGMMKLLREGWLTGDEEVVIFNTGTGLKYGECFPVDLPIIDPAGPVDYASL